MQKRTAAGVVAELFKPKWFKNVTLALLRLALTSAVDNENSQHPHICCALAKIHRARRAARLFPFIIATGQPGGVCKPQPSIPAPRRPLARYDVKGA